MFKRSNQRVCLLVLTASALTLAGCSPNAVEQHVSGGLPTRDDGDGPPGCSLSAVLGNAPNEGAVVVGCEEATATALVFQFATGDRSRPVFVETRRLSADGNPRSYIKCSSPVWDVVPCSSEVLQGTEVSVNFELGGGVSCESRISALISLARPCPAESICVDNLPARVAGPIRPSGC